MLASLAALATVGGSADAQSNRSSGLIEQRGLAYATVDGEPILLDAYLPATSTQKRPAIVLIHGGGWASGDRASLVYEARRLALLGYVTFSVDYRLAPAHPYPAAIDDVRTAIRWLRQPTQVGTFRIDPSRIGALGASAGGNLAGLLATLGRGSLTKDARIRAAVSWSGPMDLTRESDTYSAVTGGTSVRAFVDCLPAVLECAATEAAASPVTHVDRTDAPMLLMNSDAELVPVDQASVMANALKAAHVKYQLMIFPGARHAEEFADEAFPITLAFFERYLG